LVRDIEKVEVEVASVLQPPEIQEVLDRFPDEVKGKHPQPEVPEARHILGALWNKNLGELLATAKLAVIDALGEECQKKGYERHVAVSH
jgi:hypothetical protein